MRRRARCAGCGANTAIAERLIAAALLAVQLGAVLWFTWPRPRHRSHLGWIGRATAAFVLPSLAALAVLGRGTALSEVPRAFDPVAAQLPLVDPVAMLPAILAGLPIGLAIVWLRIWWLRRRGRALPGSIVAPAPLAARSNAELLPAIATSTVAGMSEELAFRLALPLLFTLVTGNAWIGFAAATVIFVALHRYQPWAGRIGVTLTAITFVALYLATGALWLVMLVHALIDIVALAVRPWLAGFGPAVRQDG